jgi:AcrR family transcriptional regulator
LPATDKFKGRPIDSITYALLLRPIDEMAQIKKPEVRAAILKSATRLFSRKGYSGTSLAEIARGAGISTTNLYVYYRSKLEIIYAIYDPWMRERFQQIERGVARRKGARAKVKYLLGALWRDLPSARNGFINNVMQALSSTRPGDHFKRTALEWKVADVSRMLREALPPQRWKTLQQAQIALLVHMAFDGFTLYNHVHRTTPLNERTVDAICSVLLGEDR